MIGYDLNKPAQNYARLIERLKKFSAYWHHLDSTWIVRTDMTCVAIRDELTKLMDSNDEILVADLTGVAAWNGFNTDGSKWLKDYL
jgi:hypothetical protein